ncbi:uncharacterized protein LOC105697214 isoform X2 [Orussus abietinus]|uniref:uncharacterized protein LOC105697214 isoform X2 n=1 Tax=Orussus abietinus TaxID=222816 RepID=UPI000625CF7A|nr:uncharacterized protein LOC105697214 isoform X2 [Orussus abietinus]
MINKNYCEWGLCQPYQYCCGDNICCSKSSGLFWILGVLASLIALILGCAFLFRKVECCRSLLQRSRVRLHHYARLPSTNPEV